jgi:hypothetical protein
MLSYRALNMNERKHLRPHVYNNWHRARGLFSAKQILIFIEDNEAAYFHAVFELDRSMWEGDHFNDSTVGAYYY